MDSVEIFHNKTLINLSQGIGGRGQENKHNNCQWCRGLDGCGGQICVLQRERTRPCPFLTKGAEEYCKAHGKNTIYLHVRLGDEAARSLYDTNGYHEVAADSWLVKLQNRTPNALMCKHL